MSRRSRASPHARFRRRIEAPPSSKEERCRVSRISEDPEAGFRAATKAAVDNYKAEHGAPEPGKPVRLRVAEMYVEVQNPIHDYIVVLDTDG